MIDESAARGVAAPAVRVVCPYLGLADDPRTRFSFAITAHRCHSGARPERIEISHQEAFCLGLGFQACDRFARAGSADISPRARVVPGAAIGVAIRNGLTGIADGIRPVLVPGAPRTLAIRVALIVGAAIVVLLVLAGIVGHGGLPSITPGASPSGAAVSVSPTPTNSVPSPSSATKTPALPTVHIVVRGETLSSIARHFGVTVAAIQKANGIKPPSIITIGERLVIPAP